MLCLNFRACHKGSKEKRKTKKVWSSWTCASSWTPEEETGDTRFDSLVLFMRLRCIFVSITAQKSCRNSLEVVYMPEKLLQHFWDIGSSVSLIFQTFQCWLNSEWSLNFFPKLHPRWKQKLLVWTPLCLCLCFSSTTVSLCPFILLRYYVVVFITLEELRVMFKKSYASCFISFEGMLYFPPGGTDSMSAKLIIIISSWVVTGVTLPYGMKGQLPHQTMYLTMRISMTKSYYINIVIFSLKLDGGGRPIYYNL